MTPFRVTVNVDSSAIGNIVMSDDVQADITRRANNMLNMQRSLVAVDTGDLKRSLEVRSADKGGRRIGSFGIHYAADQEFGWTTRSGRFISGQPYLRPSIDSAAR